jgi:hypothetical protein
MPHEERHLSDEMLLLAADHELSPRREAEALAHLEKCPACCARMAQLQIVVTDLSRARHEGIGSVLPPVAGSRAALRAELAALSNDSERSAWLDPLANLFVGSRWAYVAAIFLVAALGLRLLSRDIRLRDSQTLLASAGEGPLLPEPNLTPGATRPINTNQVCTPGPPDQMATIPVSVRRAVFHEYGMDSSQSQEYEVDHLITPELGGTDDIRNLWPEPYATTEWNAHVKDELENRLQRLVCDGKLDLPTAQRDIATNWISAYQKYFRTDKPLSNVSSLIWMERRERMGEAWPPLAWIVPTTAR